MKIDSFDLIRIFTSLQLILVCFFLLSYNGNKQRNRVLSLFLFAQVSYILTGIFNGVHQYFKSDYIVYFHIIYSFSYLLGPSIYIYIQYFTVKNFSLQAKHVYHFFVFLIFLISNLIFLHIPSTDIFLFSKDIIYTSPTIAAIILLHLQILIYLRYSILALKKHNLVNSDYYPVNGSRFYSWLKFLIYGFLLIWILESMIYFTHTYFSLLLCEVKIILANLQFVIANIIVFQGLKQPDIFQKETLHLKYQKNALKEQNKYDYLNKLLQYMEVEKPYFNSTLTLDHLSDRTSIPPHHISQILNIILKKSFRDFINSYRIEESKKLLLTHSPNKKTISEIMYEVGFSSKSVFNNAFKKHTGLTPKEFRTQKYS